MRQRIIGIVITLLAGMSLLVIIILGMPAVSKPPVTFPITRQSSAAAYAQEFNQPQGMGNGRKDWISPDGRWEFFFEEDYRDSFGSAGFFSLRLRDNATTKQRILFTLWDADPGSGVCVSARWSGDAKALKLKGDTRGYNYENPRTHSTYESFDFIYLVDEDKLYDASSAKNSSTN